MGVKILTTFKVPVEIRLKSFEIEEARRAINTHYLGVEDANTVDENGAIVSKYPDKETLEFLEAHRRVGRTHVEYLLVDVDEFGNFTIRKGEHENTTT